MNRTIYTPEHMGQFYDFNERNDITKMWGNDRKDDSNA